MRFSSNTKSINHQQNLFFYIVITQKRITVNTFQKFSKIISVQNFFLYTMIPIIAFKFNTFIIVTYTMSGVHLIPTV